MWQLAFYNHNNNNSPLEMKNGNEIPAPVRAHSKGDFKTYRTFSRGSNRTCTFFAIDKIYLSIIQKKNIVISLYLGKWYPYATVTNTATKLVVWRNTHLLYCNMGSLMEVRRSKDRVPSWRSLSCHFQLPEATRFSRLAAVSFTSQTLLSSFSGFCFLPPFFLGLWLPCLPR